MVNIRCQLLCVECPCILSISSRFFMEEEVLLLRDFIEKQKILSEARRFRGGDKDFLICTCNCQLFFTMSWLVDLETAKISQSRDRNNYIVCLLFHSCIFFFRECKFDSKCQKKISWSIDQSLLFSHNRGSTVKSRKLKPFLLGWFYQTLCKVG